MAGRAGAHPLSTFPFLDRYELLAVYAACDLVALPSFYDGLPNVALEAAALGIPLLASDAGGLADLVDDEIGFRFPAGDAHGCRAAVHRAARVRPRRAGQARGRRGRAGARATSARSARSTGTCGCSAEVGVIVCYAAGGGLGHLTRIRAFLHTMRPGRERGRSSRRRRTPLTRASSVRTGRSDRRRPGRPGRWYVAALAELAPRELVVDAFPGGLYGELTPGASGVRVRRSRPISPGCCGGRATAPSPPGRCRTTTTTRAAVPLSVMPSCMILIDVAWKRSSPSADLRRSTRSGICSAPRVRSHQSAPTTRAFSRPEAAAET